MILQLGPQVKMQIAAKLKGHSADNNAEDYADDDDNIYSEATFLPDTDPDEGIYVCTYA